MPDIIELPEPPNRGAALNTLFCFNQMMEAKNTANRYTIKQ
ncbi:hypothetical protein [Acinetobacter seifertii]